MTSDNPDTPDIDESQVPAPAEPAETTISNVEFVVKGEQALIPMRVVRLSAVRNGETVPIVTMSVRAAARLRDMLAAEVAFEEQLPPVDPVAG